MKKAFTSWSGGKDGCYACYLAGKNGIDVRYIMTMADDKGEWSQFHRFPPTVVQQQADALGVKMIYQLSTLDTYEDDFVTGVTEMKKDGIECGVFGDIETDHHRKWVEDICERSGVEAYLPLWHMSQDAIMEDFIKQGFVAVITACNEKYMGEEWLGRVMDEQFMAEIAEMQKTCDITPCGENGEFHSMVIDGPIFSRRIELEQTANRFNNGYWFLEVQKSRLVEK